MFNRLPPHTPADEPRHHGGYNMKHKPISAVGAVLRDGRHNTGARKNVIISNVMPSYTPEDPI